MSVSQNNNSNRYIWGLEINQVEQILEEENANFKKIKKETQEDIKKIEETNRDLRRNLDRIKFKHHGYAKVLDEIEQKHQELDTKLESLHDFINQRPDQSDTNQWIFGQYGGPQDKRENVYYLHQMKETLEEELEKLKKLQEQQKKELEFAYLQVPPKDNK